MRGQLRVYLGAAPGVGKTYAMLNEGRRRLERGADVVIGIVETHGREHTAAQVGDLEVVPRHRLEHRGTAFDELDVDAVLVRRPELVLIDELAHTNAPGSRHDKRWQDVDDLLDAGIDVISTLNVQHLESVNDVVERITGVRQAERIPDELVRRAEQIELVDMTPEALRRRLAHGNVYGADRIDAALSNYFRPGNLAALRELALLWVADQVEDSLGAYRQRHGIVDTWETRERVLVALTGAPGADAVIRRAARMARRAHGDLLGVYVRSDDGLAGPSSDLLDTHRRLLADLGGIYHELVGGDVATAVLHFASAENCTQVVLGASRRSRWNELVRGSVVNRIVAASGTVDVHVITYETPPGVPSRGRPPLRRSGRHRAVSLRRQAAAWVTAVLCLPLLTLALVQARDALELSSVLLVYLLAVVTVAVIGGRLPSLAAAVGAFLLANWYFTPPFHRLSIADREHVLALGVFVAVALVVGGFVAAAARRSVEAGRARAEAGALARVAATLTQSDPLSSLVGHLRSTFALDAVAVLRDPGGDPGQPWVVEAASGERLPLRPADAGLTESLAPDVVLAAIGPDLTAEDRRVLKAFTAHLAAALEREALNEAARERDVLARADELRTALLQAVSHDLRTPLAAIKASASSLRQHDVEWEPEVVDEFLATIEDETDRLTRLVTNLLDVSRIQAGAVHASLRPVGVEEVVPVALAGLGPRSRCVDSELSETLPRVAADPALLERVVANLVSNGLAWSPAGQRVHVRADRHGDRVSLLVVDHGPGIPAAERQRVLRPFQRHGDGGHANANGVGLGLAVADGFTRAMDGELRLEDTPGGGLTVVISLNVDAASGSDVGADEADVAQEVGP